MVFGRLLCFQIMMLNPHFNKIVRWCSGRDSRDLVVFAVTGVLLLGIVVLARSDFLYALVMHPPRGFPVLCLLKKTTGIPCPGCGLTHAFLAALRGHFTQSLHLHPLGIPLLVYGIAQFAKSGFSFLFLAGKAPVPSIERIGRALDVAGILFIVLLIVNWLVEIGPFPVHP